ncbi:MAG TPA: hypothetical protein VFC51_17670 [Chloroflexota bacterium]|nr:hypothetical protein [Chloroflexota bacterium]
MSGHVRLYAGTERGLSVWREGLAGWEVVGPGIPKEPCRAVAGSRSTPERVFAGVEHDGVYRTDDAGRSWTKLLEHDVWSLTVDPTDDRVIYAGTAPVHLYRSEDSGQHWEELTGLQELPPEIRARQIYPVLGEESHILNIFVDPENPKHIVLALEHGGVIRSDDRGETWEDATEGIDYVDIHMVTKLQGRAQYFAATARGFFSTTDLARGWTRAENGFTRDYFYKFIVVPSQDPTADPVMLISTGDKSPGSWNRPEGARGAIFRSLDSGESWHRVGAGAGLPEDMRERAWSFVPHPHDRNAVFTGLGRYPYPNVDTGPGAIALTRDMGEHWEIMPGIQVKPVWGLWAAADD